MKKSKIFFRFPTGDIIQLRELLNTCVKKESNPAEQVSDSNSPPLQSLESDSLQIHQSDIAKLRSAHSYELLKSRYGNHSQKIENYRFSSKGFLILHGDMTPLHLRLSYQRSFFPFRFNSLFLWPAILSALPLAERFEEPEEHLEESGERWFRKPKRTK